MTGMARPPLEIRFSNPWTDPSTSVHYSVGDSATLPYAIAHSLIAAGYAVETTEPVTPLADPLTQYLLKSVGRAAPWRVLVACQSTQTNDVDFIDPVTRKEVGRYVSAAPGADVTPTGLAVSLDGRVGYTSLKSAEGQAVSRFDTLTGEEIGEWVTTALQPADCALSPDGATLYVVCKQGRSLDVIDTQSWTKTASLALPTGSGPQKIAITPDGATALITCNSNGTVQPVALPGLTLGTAIAVGANPYGICISDDGLTAYVANNGTTAQSVSVIDVPSLTVRTTITGLGAAGVGGPMGVTLTPDRATLLVTLKAASQVVPVPVATLAPGAAISVGSTPYDVVCTPDGRYAYVACYGAVANDVAGVVSVIDLHNRVHLSDVATSGGNPISVRIAAADKWARAYADAQIKPLPTSAVLGMSPSVVQTCRAQEAWGSHTWASGELLIVCASPLVDVTIGKLWCRTGTGTPAGGALARLGVFRLKADGSRVLLAATANDPTLAAAASSYDSRPLSAAGGLPATFKLRRGVVYGFAALFVGHTTQPKLVSSTNPVGGPLPLAEVLTGQVDLPAVIPPGATAEASNVVWLGATA